MVRQVFLSSQKSGVNNEMTVYANDKDEIFIQITVPGDEDLECYSFICLDINTAIKFSKELRRQIAYIKTGGEDE